MKKSELSKQNIWTKFINKAINKAGRDMDSQLRKEYYLTDGKIKVRGTVKKADYILYHTRANISLAIVEGKSNDKSLGTGLSQALDYAQVLNVFLLLVPMVMDLLSMIGRYL